MDQPRDLERELRDVLRRSEAVLEVIETAATAGFWFVDLGRPERAWSSPGLAALLGSPPDAAPTWWRDRIHPDDRERVLAGLTSQCDDPARQSEQVFRYLRLDGSPIWVLCRARVLSGDSGEPRWLLGVQLDLTALKQAETHQRERAEAVDQQVGELFSRAVSHDLLAPARIVRSFGALLASSAGEKLSETEAEYLAHIRRGGDLMSELVGGLYRFSQGIDLDEPSTEVDLSALAGEVKAELAATASGARAVITAAGLPVVTGHRTQLYLLLFNLVDNAVKFNERTPEIDIAARDEGDAWAIEVRDNGIGIEERHFERIFELLERLHTRAEYPGAGVGLALCARIARNHGGSVRVSSTPGGGSCFTARLAKL